MTNLNREERFLLYSSKRIIVFGSMNVTHMIYFIKYNMTVTLREYATAFNKFVEDHPQALDLPVVSSQDIEGNGYRLLYHNTPQIGTFDGSQFYSKEDQKAMNVEGESDVVCIN